MRTVLAVVLVALALAPRPALADGPRPGPRIDVTMADTLPPERQRRWERAGGPIALQRALESELARSGWPGATPAAALELTVTGYRMRPGTSPPWLVYGIIPPYRVDHLADGDAIDLVATVRDGDRRMIARYRVTAQRPDGPGPRDASSRATRLAQAAARRVALTLANRMPAGRPASPTGDRISRSLR